VSSDARLLLAIRTILVTTRVAFRRHERAGMDDLAGAAAVRGVELLRRLSQELPPDAADRVARAVRDAERELRGLMTTLSGRRPGDR